MALTLHPGNQVQLRRLPLRHEPKVRRTRRQARAVVVAEAPVVEFTWANRRPGTDGFARWTAQLGARITSRAWTRSPRTSTSSSPRLAAYGVALVAAGVLADPAQPEPARHRAFAHVASALVATPHPLGA